MNTIAVAKNILQSKLLVLFIIGVLALSVFSLIKHKDEWDIIALFIVVTLLHIPYMRCIGGLITKIECFRKALNES